MNALLRQHRYALTITLRRLAKQPFSSLANLLVMALALALPLLGAAILVSVQPVARQVRGDVGARRHGNNLRHGASTSKLRARF